MKVQLTQIEIAKAIQFYAKSTLGYDINNIAFKWDQYGGDNKITCEANLLNVPEPVAPKFERKEVPVGGTLPELDIT